MEFKHAIFLENVIGKKENYFKDYLPDYFEGEKFVKFGEPRIEEAVNNNKKRLEPQIFDEEGNCSMFTIYIHLNTVEGETLFFYDKRNCFRTNCVLGSGVIFSYHVKYLENGGLKLKIPVFYTSPKFSSFRFYPLRKVKKVRFK